MAKQPKKPPTIEDARKAVEVLRSFGRNRLNEDAQHSYGACVGLGIASVTDSVLDASMAMLEDWNYHVAVAAIAALQGMPGQGTATRKGCTLTILLPEHWADLPSR